MDYFEFPGQSRRLAHMNFYLRSMKFENLHLGAVFQPDWDSRPIRVIAFDAEQVMYDCWHPHIPGWGMSSFSRNLAYYRLTTSFVLARAQYLRTEEYTARERSVHRPDLPFSFARCADLDWPMNCPVATKDFPGKGTAALPGPENEPLVLEASQVYLSPFGPKGGPKPSALIAAENGKYFSVEKILFHAARLQYQHLRDVKVTKGVGVYRLGIQRSLPSYYVWGAKSRME